VSRLARAVALASRRLAGWLLALLMWRPFRTRLVGLLSTARRVLLVRIDNRVGEALLTSPLVGALAGRFEVELVVHPRCVRVLEGLPGVAAIHPFERRWLWLGPLSPGVRSLRARSRGAVVVSCASWNQHSGTAAVVARLIAPRACTVGPSVLPAAALMDVVVPARADAGSEHLQRLHLLSPLLGEVPRAPLAFRTPRLAEGSPVPGAQVREPFVVVNPGGRLDERRVSPGVFSALCRQALELGRKVLVTWGPGEERLAGAVAALAPGAVLAPPTSLDELAWLMRRAQVVICNNTGPMHLAVAVGAPTLALFYRMPVERWGHDWPPHRMVDLTPWASSEEMCRLACGELTRLLPGAKPAEPGTWTPGDPR